MFVKFLDTSSVLETKECLTGCVLSYVTLNELEDIKVSRTKDENVKQKAREAVRKIEKDSPEIILYSKEIDELIELRDIPKNNDSLIICSFEYYANKNGLSKDNFVVYSEDYLFRLISSNVFGYKTNSVKETDEYYKGYRLFVGDTNEINSYMENLDYSEWNVNEYLIIEDKDTHTRTEMRFNGTRFVNLRLPPSNIVKGKDSLQRCALDALMNKDISIVALLGTYGSGKSYLSTQMAIYHVLEKNNQTKILGVREPIGEGQEIGFLKGDFESKTEGMFLPIKQQMEENTYDYLVTRKTIETNIPYFMKGCTYPDTVVLLEEAEDLDTKQLKLIGTRLGENSRIFISGDYKQSVKDKSLNNSLITLCNKFKGNPNFACITLEEDVRSYTSKMFADLL